MSTPSTSSSIMSFSLPSPSLAAMARCKSASENSALYAYREKHCIRFILNDNNLFVVKIHNKVYLLILFLIWWKLIYVIIVMRNASTNGSCRSVDCIFCISLEWGSWIFSSNCNYLFKIQYAFLKKKILLGNVI